MWKDKTQAHHSDFLELADVDGDGRGELIYEHCGRSAAKGPAMIVGAGTGQQKAMVHYRGKVKGPGRQRPGRRDHALRRLALGF